jgi:hypothetical protein
LFVYITEYLIYIQKIQLQIKRISVLFEGGGSLSDAAEEASSSMLQTDILFSPDPIFLFAGSLLIFGLFITFSFYTNVENMINGVLDQTLERWLVTSWLLFAGFSIVLFAGYGTNISRGFATATVIVAPVAAIAAANIRHELGTVGTVTVIVVLVAGAYLGIASPTSAIPERVNGNQPLLTESEINIVSYISENEIEAYGHPYISGRERHSKIATGQTESWLTPYYFGYPPPEDLFSTYASNHPETPFVHRRFHEERSGTAPPATYSTIYESGGSQIVLPNRETHLPIQSQ